MRLFRKYRITELQCRISLPELRKRARIVVIDDDPNKGGKDSKKKFDEINDFVFDSNEEKTKEKVYVLKDVVGIENMFTTGDLKLIDSNIQDKKNKSEAVGSGRKVLFARIFFEKVESGKVKNKHISKTAKDNFTKAFNFIDNNLKVS